MSVLIEDSPRRLPGWILDSVVNGIASGTIITPWATPWITRTGRGGRHGARDRVQILQDNGVETWFDPITHALQMDDVGDFRYYDEYSLWAGPRGDLSNAGFGE